MKGYYQIVIRRAMSGALRILDMHNHILPGFYEILMAKSVTDNKGTVIDTLAFGNGVGTHPNSATSFNGEKVFEKTYTTYTPPSNFNPVLMASEFIHTLNFTAIVNESFQVGEVGVGTYIDGKFVLASMVHLQDSNGNPTSIMLFPGDELSIVWNLIVARPMIVSDSVSALQPALQTDVGLISYSGNSSQHTIDYEMMAAYPNWHLMGLNRILNLILERNALITKTEWYWAKRIGNTNTYEKTTSPTFAALLSGAVIATDSTVAGYTATRFIFIPNYIGPMKMQFMRNDLNEYIPTVMTVKMSIEDLYTNWLSHFNSPDGQMDTPSIVNDLEVTWYLNTKTSAAVSRGVFTASIKTTPFVFVTIYQNGTVIYRNIANEFGHISYANAAIQYDDTITVRAHIQGHQQVKEFVVEKPQQETSGIVAYSGLTSSPSNQFERGSMRLHFRVAASSLGNVFDITMVPTLKEVPGVTRYMPYVSRQLQIAYGDRYNVIYIDGMHVAGDKFTFTIKDPTTYNVLETYEFILNDMSQTTENVNEFSANRDLVLFKMKVTPIL